MVELFNAADYLVKRHVDHGDGDRVAVSGRTTLTYAQLGELAGQVAAGYRLAGLRRDDRVVMVMSDDIPMLAAILGAFHAGVVAVPVSTMLNHHELGKLLSDSGARVVMCTSEFAESVGPALELAPDVETVVLSGKGTVDVSADVTLIPWDEFVEGGASAPPPLRDSAATEEDSWALWLYTSGTTGMPKAAMHRHANIRHVCETYGDQVLGIRPDDVTLSVAKMFFAYGIGNSVFFPLSTGATTLLEPRRPTPETIRERLMGDEPSLFFGVPTFYAALLASDIPDNAFASVRLAVSAGEALPESLLRRFKDRFGIDIIDGIGSTEALHIFLSNQPGEIRPGTTGRPVPGYDVLIVDDTGTEVADGRAGALHVRGASIALGYWRRAEASRQAFRGEWLVTGDTYVRDDDGYFTCLGRNTDMLKAGGIWVSPAEVESRLLEHPAVVEAAVVGQTNEDGLDKPVAAVVLTPGQTVDEAALISWCRDGLAHFKAPRSIVFLDSLPKTATGKLQRFKVRALLADDREVLEDPQAQGASS